MGEGEGGNGELKATSTRNITTTTTTAAIGVVVMVWVVVVIKIIDGVVIYGVFTNITTAATTIGHGIVCTYGLDFRIGYYPASALEGPNSRCSCSILRDFDLDGRRKLDI